MQKIKVSKKLQKAVEHAEEIWEENYYNATKTLRERLQEVKTVMRNHGFDCIVCSKAISTHLPYWHGWRRDWKGEPQYCMRWHSGYVMSINNIKEVVEDEESNC